MCFFFPVWSQSQYYCHWIYGFYLHRFSALSFWSDGCSWNQTGFYSNPFTFAGYRNNRFFLLTINYRTGGYKKIPMVIFQAWVTCGTSVNWIFLWIKLFYLGRTLVPPIYMGKPVGSRKYWMNDHCGTKWRLIKCRLSIDWYPESSNPTLPRFTSDNEMQSPFAPLCGAAIRILSISHAFYH